MGTSLHWDFFGDKNKNLNLLAEAISSLPFNHSSQIKTVLERGR